MKKNLLGLEITDICSDGTTVYKCDDALEKAFEEVMRNSAGSKRKRTYSPEYTKAVFCSRLAEYLEGLGVLSTRRFLVVEREEISSQWARRDLVSPTKVELAVAIESDLSRELLKLRVFLGPANETSILPVSVLNEGLQELFSVSNLVRFYYTGVGPAKFSPAHELPIVLEGACDLVRNIPLITEAQKENSLILASSRYTGVSPPKNSSFDERIYLEKACNLVRDIPFIVKA